MEFDFRPGEILLIDKPLQWTSFDVVNKIRSRIKHYEKSCKPDVAGKIKVGHAGTLDPLATGLLIIATGKKTKSLAEYQDRDKTYVGTIRLGEVTASYDGETPPEKPMPFAHITEEMIDRAMDRFRGEITQLPPVFSAVKYQGRRLYEHAREGEEVVRPARMLTIHQFRLKKMELPDIEVEVHCSKGTYIRSLAHDLGQVLGTGGWLTSLRRTTIGEFHIKDAYQLEEMIQFINDMEKRDTPV